MHRRAGEETRGAGIWKREQGGKERDSKETVGRPTALMFIQLALTAHLLCMRPWNLTAQAWSFTDDKTGLER